MLDLGLNLSRGVLTIRFNGWWIEVEPHGRRGAVEWGHVSREIEELTRDQT